MRTTPSAARHLLLLPAILLFLGCFLESGVEDEETAVTPRSVQATHAADPGATGQSPAERLLHEQRTMSSKACASCHPAIYAEHERSTHGRAFTDPEVRLATGRFSHGDCIICHTPRPIFETGIGMNPMRRHFDLEEGNTCMTCHWKEGYDYGLFQGGAECTEAFDPRVGEVEACASCHRNHGTPYQWALAPLGKGRDRKCVDCHMPAVTRPVAVGTEPRSVSSHGFPGSRDEAHLRRAYAYAAEIDGNEVVVRIKNKGTGHNFPTELKQRSVESLVVIKDVDGNEVARSRMVFRDPYKRPYGLHLPVNTQIPSGQEVEHRVPIQISGGTAECELHFKLYYPIEDHHPDLARRLELRKLVFSDLEPSEKPVLSAPDVKVVTPEAIQVAEASPANLVDYARPSIDTVEVEIPEGDSPEVMAQLIELFQFPVPAANAEARKRLAEIGAPAIPQLVEAMGSWDNKTWNQAMAVLAKIGEPAVGPVAASLASDQLYVRVHARELLVRLEARGLPEVETALREGLALPNAMDRASAAHALGELGAQDAAGALTEALTDRDPDVVRAAAFALARLGHADAVPAIRAAVDRFIYPETRRDLATALTRLDSRLGVPILLAGLDEDDDLVRESYFEAFFAATGLHLGYDPLAPRPERLDAISRLAGYWTKRGDETNLRPWRPPSEHDQAEVWSLVQKLADGGDDEPVRARLLEQGEIAVPGLVLGLKFPPGFAAKRVQICELLGAIESYDAVPALVATLRDPVISVAAWACWALESIGDPEALTAVQRFERRLHTLAAAGTIPPTAGHPDALLAQAARARMALGETSAARDLVTLLLSQDPAARDVAIQSLKRAFGYDLDYRSDGSLEERRRAAAAWAEEVQ